MSELLKSYLFGVFGISCKVLFFTISITTTYHYNKIICLVLIGIFVLRNIITLWYFKGKKVKVDIK